MEHTAPLELGMPQEIKHEAAKATSGAPVLDDKAFIASKQFSPKSYCSPPSIQSASFRNLLDLIARQTPEAADESSQKTHKEEIVHTAQQTKHATSKSLADLLQIPRLTDVPEPTPQTEQAAEVEEADNWMTRLLRAAPGAREAGHVALITAFICLL